MKKILFMENLTDAKSSKLAHAVEIAKTKGLELTALFVIPVHPDVTDWIDVQEKQVREAEAKVKEYAEKMASELKEQGVAFNGTVVQSMPDAWMKSMESSIPADVVMVGKVNLDPLAEKGIKTLEDLSGHLKCPVFPIESMMIEKQKTHRINIFRFAAFGVLSAVSYFMFFPRIEQLNYAIFMKGTLLGALAVLVTVPIHAYVYGSFTEYFPKFMGLEKSMNKHSS